MLVYMLFFSNCFHGLYTILLNVFLIHKINFYATLPLNFVKLFTIYALCSYLQRIYCTNHTYCSGTFINEIVSVFTQPVLSGNLFYIKCNDELCVLVIKLPQKIYAFEEKKHSTYIYFLYHLWDILIYYVPNITEIT